ncbi:MAG TPA: hypothetical protein VGL54_10725 [Solirubrobacteraceae bacterium]|jgi:hypothetical protein
MQSFTVNPRLSVFEPYEDLARGHEDQLTRAAMIVLRLVPLARETLLHEIGERSLSQLPDCTVDLQATHLVDPTEEGARAGRVKRGRLVSVFLTPDFEPPRIEEEISETDRGQRFDGVLRFDPDLVVLIESKVCRRWARRNGHRVSEVNLGGVEFAERRTCLLRWHDLLESWWRLVEIGVLSPVEQMLIGDLLGYAHQDFAELLPFGSLRRVGEDPLRRRWRLRSLLREATSIQPERVGLVHVRLDTGLGCKALQRAALEIDDHALTLHLWPGELKPQAQALYTAGRAERLAELDEGDGGPWRVAPQPLLGFRSAPKRVRVYLTCTLDAATYARRWQGEDWSRVGAHHRETIIPELWPWLLERGYASPQDEEPLERFMQTLGRRALHLRPALHVSRTWSFAEAEVLDDAGLLVGEVHEAINRVLALLDEPLVQTLAASGSDEPIPPAVPTPAKRTRRPSQKPRKRTRAKQAATAKRAAMR